ncbi:MAG: RsmB/NOP family class I SAM-dependent RNA methyltransferase [Candidatus Bipolaricaulota bacterium]|nr:RsmB/NOP family class I SAM-dependent RNA methyltransferase [Candidatus Bipolaricaulota bacterium]MDW8126759.1 RsmB/NOP family class I SAM-dependent RNA methyltransferase [Candidatus Bipolaricaulota bacterium]
MDRYREIIPEWEEFWEALERPMPPVIRTNTLRIEPSTLKRRLESKGFDLRPLPWDASCFVVEGDIPVGNTLEHWLGYYYVQEATQLLPVKALAPRPGEHILDLCAAPGGKTTQIAQYMEDQGLLVANDHSGKRIQALLTNLYRLGVRCAVVTECPGENFPGEAKFDRVLVDAPCSGEGIARRFPHLRRGAPLGTIRRLSILQKRLLTRALKLVRPGGIVVYSTCTLAPEENEAVVNHVLSQGLAELVPWEPPVPHAPGLVHFDGEEYRAELAKAVRIYPHHFDSEGGFIAVLRRPN